MFPVSRDAQVAVRVEGNENLRQKKICHLLLFVFINNADLKNNSRNYTKALRLLGAQIVAINLLKVNLEQMKNNEITY